MKRCLLILPCNAGACTGDYFNADSKRKPWNSLWREADLTFRDLRSKGRLALAAVDSSTLETEPNGSKGAIVFEIEMDRVKNSNGEDWGAPSWRWFKPTRSGRNEYFDALTEALVKGIRRVESMSFARVFVLVNPQGYFLSLATALDRCRLLDKWTLFRVPPHPCYLLPAFRKIVPFMKTVMNGRKFKGGIYFVGGLGKNKVGKSAPRVSFSDS
jgi:hypothetical protein